MNGIADAVTALFVPGDRPDRYAKAAGAGADVVVLDLEDAVAEPAKAEARASVVRALAPGADPWLRALVRVNGATTATYDADVAALLELVGRPGHGVVGVMVPKADDPGELARLAAALAAATADPAPPVLALVESALGVLRALELASVPGVARLAFGALDLAADLGTAPEGPVADHARAQLVLASRAAGRPAPLHSPSTEIGNAEAVRGAARRARALGFGGQLCIHPAQLAAVREAFAPTAEELAWARRVLDAGDGAVQLDGRMVDRPVVERARRLLARAEDAPRT